MTEIAVDELTVKAWALVAAPPEEVFDYVRRPANHAEISGDGTVKGALAGPERLGEGDRFGMKMRLGVPYRIKSKVVEFEENRRIAWAHIGGHRWRWEVEPAGDGTTRVTETFDMSKSRSKLSMRLFGYPEGHRENVANSVANVANHFKK